MLSIDKKWHAILGNEFEKPYFNALQQKLEARSVDKTIYPKKEDVFRAFTLTPFESVKVIILGQDPYHGPGQAHGLAFSVIDSITIPPSLKNIFRELSADLGCPLKTSGDLSHWAREGVLLLNTVLTVEANNPASHRTLGWELFTDTIIRTLVAQHNHLVFLLWGAEAAKKRTLIDETKHLILTASHPSPLSAHRGFFGCRHFSTCNDYLQKNNKKPIKW